jgi:hypothetical protein
LLLGRLSLLAAGLEESGSWGNWKKRLQLLLSWLSLLLLLLLLKLQPPPPVLVLHPPHLFSSSSSSPLLCSAVCHHHHHHFLSSFSDPFAAQQCVCASPSLSFLPLELLSPPFSASFPSLSRERKIERKRDERVDWGLATVAVSCMWQPRPMEIFFFFWRGREGREGKGREGKGGEAVS